MSMIKPIVVDGDVGEACIANISPAERRKRLNSAIVMFVIAIVLLGLLMVAGADRLWRLPLFLLFAGATVGYFQWHDKTCVALANTNSRQTGDKKETIEDASELAQIKHQARRVLIKGAVAAVPLTVIAMLLPALS